MIKVAVVTSNRADYGLLHPLINLLNIDTDINLRLLVTGSHLDDFYGYTINEIIEDGFDIHETIKIPSTNNKSISQCISDSIMTYDKALRNCQPDWVILLGDRFEIYTFALSSFLLNIKIAHISGGEVTSGAIDDTFRHCITKMSELHFTSHETYKKRVIQLGESPDRVFNVGALSTENFYNYNEVKPFEEVDFYNSKAIAICTVHPVTSGEDSISLINNLLSSLLEFEDLFVIFTASNMDEGGKDINNIIKEFCDNNKNRSFYYKSLGKDRYYSALKIVDFMIGNSSSGITEAPLFGINSINIGSRQEGRILFPSVIQSNLEKEDITAAISKALNQKSKERSNHKLGDGYTSKKIISILKQHNKDNKKVFYDIEF